MDWTKNSWELEDSLYFPKRKVNNRGSYRHPHIIGGFFSRKMQRTVEYESLAERLYYYFLELDQNVYRYYVQPIEVPIPTKENFWLHIPDVLVYRQGFRPLLHQIKSDEQSEEQKLDRINYQCEKFALANNWNYKVIYPKSLPPLLQRNIRFLKGFLKERYYYKEWKDSVIQRLEVMEVTTVEILSQRIKENIDPLLIKPLIFHLIAIGYFIVNVNEEINSNTMVTINKEMNI